MLFSSQMLGHLSPKRDRVLTKRAPFRKHSRQMTLPHISAPRAPKFSPQPGNLFIDEIA